IGSPYETPDSATPEAGLAYLFDGASGDLLHTFQLETPTHTAHFGSSVAGVEDLDGDGRGDVVIGAINGNDQRYARAGRACVFSGSSGALIHTLFSPTPYRFGGQFGFFASGIPDLNFDDKEEIAVSATIEPGAFYRSPDGPGLVHLFDGASGEFLETFSSPNGGYSFGYSMAPLPDMNGDDRPELAIGNEMENRAYVFLSRAIELDKKHLDFSERDVDEGPGAPLEFTIWNVGNEDAVIELRFQDEESNEFRVANDTIPSVVPKGASRSIQVVFDPALPVERSNVLLVKILSPRMEEFEIPLSGVGYDSKQLVVPGLLGGGDRMKVTGLSDVNGDGFGDFAVNKDAAFNNTEIFLYSGSNGEMLPIGNRTYFRTEDAIPLGVVDFTGDGLADLVVGEPGVNDGQVRLLDPSNGQYWTLAPPLDGNADDFGVSVSEIPGGDANCQRRIVVGAFLSSEENFTRSGMAYIASVSSDGATIVQELSPPTLQDHGRFGFSVSGISDLTGDGCGDVLVGSFLNQVFAFDGQSGELVRVIQSPNPTAEEFFGHSVAGMPDLDGDGSPENLVLGYNPNLLSLPGTYGNIYVFSGDDFRPIRTIPPPDFMPGLRFGKQLESLPDMTGDGIADFSIDALLNTLDEKFVLLYDGANGELFHIFSSPYSEHNLREEHAAVPDANGDGLGEMLVTGNDFAHLFYSPFPQPAISLPQSEVDFGMVEIGTGATDPFNIPIDNIGAGTLVPFTSYIEITGTDAAAFRIISLDETVSIVPGRRGYVP
ncbi:MAG: FG-GAP repeat protein, partial [Candidatus Omnitrophica bacterium]|nr:FG-GAP repeat protein [Candidatus Omnitrophota bacterium]